jgi:hypothetical protein
MLSRLTGQASHCAQRARAYRLLAADSSYDALTRHEFHEMELRWLALAQHYDNAESISNMLQWTTQRLEPPPDFEPSDLSLYSKSPRL